MNTKMKGVISVDHMPLMADIHKVVRDTNEKVHPSWDDLHYEWRLVDSNGDPVAEDDYGEFPRFNIERFNNEEIL